MRQAGSELIVHVYRRADGGSLTADLRLLFDLGDAPDGFCSNSAKGRREQKHGCQDGL